MLALGLSACSAQPPANPTWATDVQPLLVGNCGQCHGPTRNSITVPIGSGFRLDICDLTKFSDVGVDIDPKVVQDAKSAAALVRLAVVRSEEMRRMPPPPAGPLPSYDLDVIRAWTRGPACERPNNTAPRARLVGTPREDGNDVLVTVDLTDADGDTVLGKLTVGTATFDLLYTGRHVVRVQGARPDDKISITFSDGWDPAIKDVALN
jgi:hypothetical protein